MARKIIIGDIHGEFLKLQKLFDKVPLLKDDKIIFLGDYIDRGNNSRDVIDYIINLKNLYDVVTLLGNHEMFALSVMENPESYMVMSWMRNGGVACLKNYGDNIDEMGRVHGDFFRSLKLIHEEENYIFVHGYLSSDLNIADQHINSCIWNRFDDIKPHKSGKIVVCGHTIQNNGPADLGYKVCIDTGSFLPSGYITAMIIDGDKVDYVNSN